VFSSLHVRVLMSGGVRRQIGCVRDDGFLSTSELRDFLLWIGARPCELCLGSFSCHPARTFVLTGLSYQIEFFPLQC
jgi:hypothetical protein